MSKLVDQLNAAIAAKNIEGDFIGSALFTITSKQILMNEIGMAKKYTEAGVVHPLMLFPLADCSNRRRNWLDVASMSALLCNNAKFTSPDAKLLEKSYQVVAVDIIEKLTAIGYLNQIGGWFDNENKWKGGPRFYLASWLVVDLFSPEKTH